MGVTKIRPGILVNVRSAVEGGVAYERRDLTSDRPPDEGATVEKWETTKVVTDAEEHEQATKCRSKALSLIRSACVQTGFGLLCVKDREAELDAGIRAARALTDEYNATAAHTFVTVRVMKGEVASTDEESARSVGEEVARLINQMSSAVDKLDPAAIRAAAAEARELAAILSPEQEAKVGAAVKAARAAAKEIVRRVEKGGEEAAVVLTDLRLGAIESARMAFLDVSADDEEEEASGVPAPEAARLAGVDFSAEAAEYVVTKQWDGEGAPDGVFTGSMTEATE